LAGARPSACLGVMRRDQRQQPRPRNHRIHLRQELLAPRHLLLHRVTKTRNGRLFRHWLNSFGVFPELYQITTKVRGISDFA